MTAAQYTTQLITDARHQLDDAAVARFVTTGGADLDLMSVLEFWGGDLEAAGWNSDPITWSRAMTALRTLAQQQ